MIIKSILHKVKATRFHLLTTLIVNFRLLPFKQAIFLPIIIYNKTELCLGGCKKIIINCPVKFGLIKFGFNNDKQYSKYTPSLFMIVDGSLTITGPVMFSSGCTLRIHGGNMILGNNIFVGGGTKLQCCNFVSIGSETIIPFDVTISDTNFHYISHKGIVKNCCGKVVIGCKVWICNHSSVLSAVIPDNTIIASNSLVNKDFAKILDKQGALLAGIPAELKGYGYHRIIDHKLEDEIREYYKCNDQYFML